MTPNKTSRRIFLSNSTKAAAAIAVIPTFLEQALAELTSSALAKDPRRPQYHLLPASNWMNDPNGPIYWRGKYHMFCQYNPHAAVWGDMHWYHSVSPDKIHWRHLPIGLAPTPGGPDADGCFTGTAVVHNGVPTLIYTGVAKAPDSEATIHDGHSVLRETQLYATSSDPNLLTWTKRPTPVIAAPPEGMKVTGFRDPAPWREPSLAGGQWLLALGSGTKEHGGCILLYKSADLQNWEYLHVVAGGAATGSTTANPVDSGDMWECPDLFPLPSPSGQARHVLIYSTQGKVFWKVGQLDPTELVFHEQQSGLLDYGSFYAPKTQLDKSGNRILWGWIQETRPEAEYSAAGWSGLMSLPRLLTIGSGGRLHVAVDPAVEKLRKHEQKLRLAPMKPGSKELLADTHLKDACGELLCIVKPGPNPDSAPFSLDLLDTTPRNDAPKDATTAVASQVSLISVRYSHANPKELVVDQQRLPIFPENASSGPNSTTTGQPLELRFYIDGSVIELFVNNQVTCTRRFYYPGPTAPEIAVSITGNQSDIARLSLWQLTPISKDRLTT